MTRKIAAFLLAVAAASAARAQLAPVISNPAGDAPSTDVATPTETPIAENEAFRPYGDLADAVPSAVCSACGGVGCDRCGCNTMLFPWIRGPGNCDQWCVGPHWRVEAAGLILFRDDVNWNSIAASVGLPADFVSQFEAGPGARIFVTGYNDNGFGMQVGYEGVNQWNARAEFPSAGALRTFAYETRLNSVEINFLSEPSRPVQLFAGFRYVQIDEDLVDFTTVDKVIPAPADPPAAAAAYVDTGEIFQLENQLLGFQLGAVRNRWDLGRRLTIAPFANAGIYLNRFKRVDIDRTVTTVITGDDLSTPDDNEFSQTTTEVRTVERRDFNDTALVAEAGVSAVWRITRCVALRGGYQVLAVDRIGLASGAFFSNDVTDDTLIYHGAQFGLEYRR